DAGVRPGEVPEAPGGGDRPGQGEVPGGPLRRDRRRGERELGVPRAAHRRAGDRLLACGGVRGQGGDGLVPGPSPDEGGVAGGGERWTETRRGRERERRGAGAAGREGATQRGGTRC